MRFADWKRNLSDGTTVSNSVSIGVTQFIPREKPRHVIRRADEALYRAKKEGKNCVRKAG